MQLREEDSPVARRGLIAGIVLLLGILLAMAVSANAQTTASVFSTATVLANTGGPWIAMPPGLEADLEFTAIGTTAPSAAPGAALVATGTGNCTAGTHVFAVSYVTAAGETTVSPSSASVNCDSSHKQVTVTIPVSTDPAVTGRNVYTSAAGTSTPLLLVSTSPVVGNNSATTYTFNIADGSLTATNPPGSNGTGTSTATQTIYQTNDSTISCATGIAVSPAITAASSAAHKGAIVKSYKFFCVAVSGYSAGTISTTYTLIKR